MFRALVVEDREPRVEFRDLSVDDLPPGDVLISVAYSSINYKDALAVTGKGKIARSYPMVPGIDLAGTVEQSSSPEFSAGDRVLVTGRGLGESHWGGYAGMARVPADWVLPVPAPFDLKQAMAIGTAGYTAMLCLLALEHHGVRPDSGEIAVTGATGGVGSLSIALLSHLGYAVVAFSGKAEQEGLLRELGATEVLPRSALAWDASRPLVSARWAGAVDNVGEASLPALLSAMKPRGCIAATGLAGGSDLHTTVMPFILRAVVLAGIASASSSRAERHVAWERLARDLPIGALDRLTEVVDLSAVPERCERMLRGETVGRMVVDVRG